MSGTKKNDEYEYEITEGGGGVKIVEYRARELNVQVPSHIDGLPVIEIGYRAFSNNSKADLIKSVMLPDTVEVIGERAFLGCADMKSVNIPDSVKVIEDSAFEDCVSLGNVSVPSGAEIHEHAFCGGFEGEVVKR